MTSGVSEEIRVMTSASAPTSCFHSMDPIHSRQCFVCSATISVSTLAGSSSVLPFMRMGVASPSRDGSTSIPYLKPLPTASPYLLKILVDGRLRVVHVTVRHQQSKCFAVASKADETF